MDVNGWFVEARADASRIPHPPHAWFGYGSLSIGWSVELEMTVMANHFMARVWDGVCSGAGFPVGQIGLQMPLPNFA